MQNGDSRLFASRMEKKSRKSLLSGVLILTIANIAVKIFGFLYKVPLNGMLGDEMANVNAAYSVYSTLLVLSTAGIPSAVAMLVSRARAEGDEGRAERVFDVAHTALAVAGVLLTLALLFLSRFIANFNSGGDSFLCMCAISPALLFVCLSSVYRGYFQGHQIMTPTAISEVIESFSKMALGLLLAYITLGRYGSGTAAAFSVLGITLGMGLGVFYLCITFSLYRKKNPPTQTSVKGHRECRRTLWELIRLSLPIAASSAVISMAGLIDSQLMRPLLESYSGNAEYAKAVYSDYSTGAITLFNLPTILIYPIACAIIPYISAALVRGNRRGVCEVVGSSFRVCSLISMPCALGMSALATPILAFVFRGDADMPDNAGKLLSILAIAIFFIGILTVSNAVLQAHGRQSLPIISMTAGLVVKGVLVWLLTARYGAIGAPVSTLLFYAVTVIINMFFVCKYTGVALSVTSVFVKPLVCSSISSGAAFLTYTLLSDASLTLALISAIAVAVAVYIALILLLRCITLSDIRQLPHGEKRALRLSGIIKDK